MIERHFNHYFTMIVVEKNLSFTSIKNKIKLKYISERQLLSLELIFKIKLNLNSHLKYISMSICEKKNDHIQTSNMFENGNTTQVYRNH